MEAYAEKQGGIHGPLHKFLFIRYLKKSSWMATWGNGCRCAPARGKVKTKG